MDNKEFSALKNQKKPYKFNITDIFLILIIIIAASVLIYIIAGTNLFLGGDEVTVQYTIEIPLIRNEYRDAISQIMPGDKITDSVRGNDIGEIYQQVRISEGMSNTDDKITGIVRRVPHPDHSRILITVRAQAKKDGPKYVVNGKVIMVGTQIHFRTQHFMGYGNCVAFDIITED